MNQRFIKQEFNNNKEPICLIPNCNNVCEKYKTSGNYRNYCKNHNGSDMSKHTNWGCLRDEALNIYGKKCNKCGNLNEFREVKKKYNYYENEVIERYSNFVVDHIIPIALGGKEFDINNLQILCYNCNKIKTKQDSKDIANLRRKERRLIKGQTQISLGVKL